MIRFWRRREVFSTPCWEDQMAAQRILAEENIPYQLRVVNRSPGRFF